MAYRTPADQLAARQRSLAEANKRYQAKRRAERRALAEAKQVDVPGANVLVYGVDSHGRTKIIRKCLPFQAARMTVSGWFVDLQRAFWQGVAPYQESHP